MTCTLCKTQVNSLMNYENIKIMIKYVDVAVSEVVVFICCSRFWI